MNYNYGTEHLLGKNDKILEFYSKWPIYNLNVFEKKCLWYNFQKKLMELKDCLILGTIEDEDIVGFYMNNPDIDFEILYFQDLMPKNYIFKIDKTVYSYTFGYRSKRRSYVRFYFDINNFLNFNLT